MNQQEELARRYRQRLALYPRAYRREHEEEMLSVLLDGARPGQEFPRVVESLDLISGALRMRLRLLQPYGGNIGSDALAAFSLLAPLLLLGPVLATLMLHLVHGPAAPDTALRARYPALCSDPARARPGRTRREPGGGGSAGRRDRSRAATPAPRAGRDRGRVGAVDIRCPLRLQSRRRIQLLLPDLLRTGGSCPDRLAGSAPRHAVAVVEVRRRAGRCRRRTHRYMDSHYWA